MVELCANDTIHHYGIRSMPKTENKTGVTIARTTTVKLVIRGQEIEITEQEARDLYNDLSGEFAPKVPAVDWEKRFREEAERNRSRDRDYPTLPKPWCQPNPWPGATFCGGSYKPIDGEIYKTSSPVE